jgi:transcriptional regulator
MFVLDEYSTTDLNLMHQIMKEYNFANVVTSSSGECYANHFPLILNTTAGPFGTLEGHMSRSNPQWQQMQKNARILVIFNGPHAYISPSTGVSSKMLPTWNYVALHAYGSVEVIEEPREIVGIMSRSIKEFEVGIEKPWKMALPQEYLDLLVSKVVGFKLKIDRLEPQIKLNQDREKQERESVTAHLSRSHRDEDKQIAAWMEKHAIPLP